MVQKDSRKKPGKKIWRQTKGSKSWIAPTLANELDTAHTLLVVDIEKCSNFKPKCSRFIQVKLKSLFSTTTISKFINFDSMRVKICDLENFIYRR